MLECRNAQGSKDHAGDDAQESPRPVPASTALSWNILGQTYVPKQLSENSFSWHATFPPGTFVPPHIHPTQDEFIYMFEGRIDLVLDGREFVATAGDLIRLPMGIAARPLQQVGPDR